MTVAESGPTKRGSGVDWVAVVLFGLHFTISQGLYLWIVDDLHARLGSGDPLPVDKQVAELALTAMHFPLVAAESAGLLDTANDAVMPIWFGIAVIDSWLWGIFAAWLVRWVTKCISKVA